MGEPEAVLRENEQHMQAGELRCQDRLSAQTLGAAEAALLGLALRLWARSAGTPQVMLPACKARAAGSLSCWS